MPKDERLLCIAVHHSDFLVDVDVVIGDRLVREPNSAERGGVVDPRGISVQHDTGLTAIC